MIIHTSESNVRYSNKSESNTEPELKQPIKRNATTNFGGDLSF